MSQLVKSQKAFFNLLASNTSDKQKQALLDSITNDQLRALIQVVVNFLRTTITVSTTAIKELGRYKHFLRRLADITIALHHKKKLLRRRARAISDLLRAVDISLKTYLT